MRGKPSRLIPPVPNEPTATRHARRLALNMDRRDEMERWCEAHNIRLVITGIGEHWAFHLPSGLDVHWWPRTAKMVVSGNRRVEFHIHDWEQAKAQVSDVADWRRRQ